MYGGFAQINDFLNGGYGALPFGGALAPEEASDLIKALNVGSDRDPPSTFAPGDGFAFRVEDLDPLMRLSTFDMTNIILWKLLQKQAAENTVVEWNDTESYGQDGFDGFMQDGTLPEVMDSTVSRQYAFVKFIGVQAAITHGSTLVKAANNANLVAAETERKTMKLLELVERSSFYGDESLDPVQWNGFFTQIAKAVANGRAPATQIKDMRGQPIGIDDVEEGAGITASEPNYGMLTDLFCNPMVKSDLNSSLLPFNHAKQGEGSTDGGIGSDFNHVNTTIGRVNVHPDAFIHFGRKANANGLGDPVRRPPTPILTVAPSTVSDTSALFLSSDTGDYQFTLVARNRYGASVPLSIGTITLSAIARHIEMGVSAAPGNPTLYFELYRSERNGTVQQLIQRIPNPSAGFTTVTLTDLNADLPGTSTAFAVQFAPKVINFKQLAPFMKISLAQVDLNYRWAQVCYGTPILYLPKKAYMFKNVGRAKKAA